MAAGYCIMNLEMCPGAAMHTYTKLQLLIHAATQKSLGFPPYPRRVVKQQNMIFIVPRDSDCAREDQQQFTRPTVS
jgi:hypothetical protein